MKLSTTTATAQVFAAMDWSRSKASALAGKKITIGGWSAVAWQEEDVDWKCYSKSWHRTHGPKITVTGRFVQFTSPTGKVVKTIELDSWRGNWQVKALIKSGLVKPKKGQMNIRLNEAFEIKKIGQRGSLVFYSRSLKGEHFDYCVASPMGMTFHGGSLRDCVKGLRKKRQAIERRKSAVIDWKFLKSLEFCDTGIKEFCSTFGFIVKDTVTPEEVYQRVKSNPGAAEPFLAELKTLAKVTGYSVPEFD